MCSQNTLFKYLKLRNVTQTHLIKHSYQTYFFFGSQFSIFKHCKLLFELAYHWNTIHLLFFSFSLPFRLTHQMDTHPPGTTTNPSPKLTQPKNNNLTTTMTITQPTLPLWTQAKIKPNTITKSHLSNSNPNLQTLTKSTNNQTNNRKEKRIFCHQ